MDASEDLGSVVDPLATTPQGEPVLAVDEILRELNRNDEDELPEHALLAARRHRDAIIPGLITLIERAIADALEENPVAGSGHIYAYFLLTEFQAKEALPAIIEAISLPDEMPFDLFGDVFTETLPAVLAALAYDALDVIDGVISNRLVHSSIRWSVAETYLPLVRDGRLTREEAVSRLQSLLRRAIENEDGDGATSVVMGLVMFSPREAVDDIRAAFDRNLVDKTCINWFDIEQSLDAGDEYLHRYLNECAPTGFDDAIEELEAWFYALDDEDSNDDYGFDDESDYDSDNDYDKDDDSEELDPSYRAAFTRVMDILSGADKIEEPDEAERHRASDEDTIRNALPKVGRNDPCPCGSGKKYKKCCGNK